MPIYPHGLGRVFKEDVRDKNFLLAKPEVTSVRQFRTWRVIGVLDQKDTPMCVGYSTSKWVEAGPVTNKLPNPEEVYHLAQQLDDTPGEDYEGTTVRGGMKALRQLGLVSDFCWTYQLDILSHYLLEKGPVVIGSNWYENMFYPDQKGNIVLAGDVAGGHAYLAIGINTLHRNPDKSVGAIRIQNSWGAEWGDKGRCWLSFKDTKRLLDESGEAAYGTEIKQR